MTYGLCKMNFIGKLNFIYFYMDEKFRRFLEPSRNTQLKKNLFLTFPNNVMFFSRGFLFGKLKIIFFFYVDKISYNVLNHEKICL